MNRISEDCNSIQAEDTASVLVLLMMMMVVLVLMVMMIVTMTMVMISDDCQSIVVEVAALMAL